MNFIGIVRGQIKCLVTVEEKMNAPWTNNVTQRTWHSKCEVPPWNIIMIEREYTLGFRRGIETKTV